MTLEEMARDWSPDALFASNGPGDPAHPGAATDARKTLAAAVRQGMPVMGICLGHQLMGLAAGLSLALAGLGVLAVQGGGRSTLFSFRV